MKRVTAANAGLLEADGSSWTRLETRSIELFPAPVAMAAAVSPQLALSRGHGKVEKLSARSAHNGETLSIRLSWKDPQINDRVGDLDQFVDAAAVMFPLGADANPLTMGDDQKPVNVWLWKADQGEPFDVIARGYATSERRPGSASGLVARGLHRDGEWVVVFQRPLLFQRPLRADGGEFAHFPPGGSTGIAFAVWEGSNAERAGQKAVSGAFLDLKLDR